MCTIHLPAPVHQIVCLIHQENIIALDSFLKKALQIHIRIKHIIIIAQYIIHPGCHIQTHLKRTHLIFFRLRQYLLARKQIRSLQQIIHRIIHTVIMSLRIRTIHRIALQRLGAILPTHAQLFLCCQLDDLCLISMFPQNLKCFFCNRSRNCLSSQIKNPICQSLTHCFYCRKNCRNCLTYSCGCLNKKRLAPHNRTIYVCHQLSLSFPIRIGKFKLGNAFLSRFTPGNLPVCPFFILRDQMLEPVVKILPFPNLPKIPDIFRVQIAVCHLHTDTIQMILQRIYVCITHCLRLVHIYRLFHRCKIPVNPFDFVNIPKRLPDLHFILLCIN